MVNRRLGTFKIDIRIIDTQPKVVKQIMGECIIVRAEMRYETNSIHYTAISDWFDEIPEGSMPMNYVIQFVTDGINVKWCFAIGAY